MEGQIPNFDRRLTPEFGKKDLILGNEEVFTEQQDSSQEITPLLSGQ